MSVSDASPVPVPSNLERISAQAGGGGKMTDQRNADYMQNRFWLLVTGCWVKINQQQATSNKQQLTKSEKLE
jgi:hypothetical protein